MIESWSQILGKEIDIKFGEGGLQDIYFTIRYLQLRDQVPDQENNRSTLFSLKKLFENKSISAANYQILSEGYDFLSELDHNLRLTNGRSTRIPIAKKNTLETITERLKIDSVDILLETLTFHRLAIHTVFEEIFLSQIL